jgi:AcrR family transcriptional regulator
MSSPPPLRADARRNRERLMAAAESVLDERGVAASLDDIAKAAGVGNATLYRHFPSRGQLIEALYDQRISALCERATALTTSPEPGPALLTWLHELAVHVATSRVLAEAFDAEHEAAMAATDATDATEGGDAEPPQVAAWHRAIFTAAAPLLAAAQDAGAVRRDLDIVELLSLTAAVARAGSPAQADRFLGILLDGVTPR